MQMIFITDGLKSMTRETPNAREGGPEGRF